MVSLFGCNSIRVRESSVTDIYTLCSKHVNESSLSSHGGLGRSLNWWAHCFEFTVFLNYLNEILQDVHEIFHVRLQRLQRKVSVNKYQIGYNRRSCVQILMQRNERTVAAAESRRHRMFPRPYAALGRYEYRTTVRAKILAATALFLFYGSSFST